VKVPAKKSLKQRRLPVKPAALAIKAACCFDLFNTQGMQLGA
jgi:hypothetical protein